MLRLVLPLGTEMPFTAAAPPMARFTTAISISAAHPTMPLPSYARVTNLRNNYSMIVRVNDRGPFTAHRIMDVSRRTAEALDFRQTGTTRVKVEYIGAASLAGSNDQMLLATLRSDGPATFDGMENRNQFAENAPYPIASADTQPVAVARGRSCRARHDAASAGRASSRVPFLVAPRAAFRISGRTPVAACQLLSLRGSH